MSILGHYNNFFFAAHLLDIAMGFKTLRTILSSVTHNGKQVSLLQNLQAQGGNVQFWKIVDQVYVDVYNILSSSFLLAGADCGSAGCSCVSIHRGGL